jgi:dihydroorotase
VATGAPLHIVHINSTSLGSLPTVLAMVEGVQKQGFDVTAEAYPYTAGSTGLQSALFDPGWQERLGIDYGDLQWEETGERLNQETFERYREQGGTIIIHMMKEEWIDLAMNTDFVMIASDAMPYAPLAHPRSAGTYARVLGRYVRERQSVDLMTALRKMALMPAQRLEGVAPVMSKKGRVAVGADADLVIFDPETVIDRATFEQGLQFSDGIEHVLVSGTFVVRNGENVPDVFPGQPVVGRFSQ